MAKYNGEDLYEKENLDQRVGNGIAKAKSRYNKFVDTHPTTVKVGVGLKNLIMGTGKKKPTAAKAAKKMVPKKQAGSSVTPQYIMVQGPQESAPRKKRKASGKSEADKKRDHYLNIR